MKTAIRKFAALFLLLLSAFPLLSQELTKKEFIKAVQDADISYYYDEDYEKVAVLYESLLNKYPENANLAAKLGISYLNIDGKKEDALRLLKKASSNIVSDSKDYLEYGDKAALNTYLYLAIAYHQNDSLQKAISLYNVAVDKLEGDDIFQEEFIEKQIRDCKYAIEMKKKPLTILSNLFIPWLNEYPGACNPVLSKNDSVFIFTVKRDSKTHVYCSFKTDTWQKPMDITNQLGGFDRFYTNSITGDGKQLIIYMDDGGDGNLYYSVRSDTTWTKIKSIRNIKSIYWESHGFITPDGQTLYFASNRPGGEGELDIWVSERVDLDTWNLPVNCGNIINTPFNENTPFFDQETNALIFSSLGHVTMGGYDVFRSIFRNGGWTTPTPMPYAFNNTIDNSFFILNNNGPGFITSYYDNISKTRNIFSIVAEDPADKMILAVGTVSLQDGMNVDPRKTRIELADLGKNIPVREISLADTSSYKFEVKPGDYKIIVSHTGYQTDTVNLNVPLYYLSNYISINSSLIPDKVSSGDFLSIKTILFDYDSYKLNEEALSALELLKSTLNNYPELKIEVAGYTDSKGSTEYNNRLADRRAGEVIKYFTNEGISSSRFVKKAYGKSNFAAVNTNMDGTDNPEGRKYNRRVTFGIVDPQTGITLSQETFTPDHLRQPYSMRYSIVLKKTLKKLPSDYFNSLNMAERYFIKTITIDSVTLHILGVFYNKNDALKYLEYAKGKGYTEAYIVTQFEINSLSRSLINPESETRQIVYHNGFTIQLKAARRPVNMREFKDIEGVREVLATDGYYRYLFGEYRSFGKAKNELPAIKATGFNDAFVRDNDLVDIKKKIK